MKELTLETGKEENPSLPEGGSSGERRHFGLLGNARRAASGAARAPEQRGARVTVLGRSRGRVLRVTIDPRKACGAAASGASLQGQLS